MLTALKVPESLSPDSALEIPGGTACNFERPERRGFGGANSRAANRKTASPASRRGCSGRLRPVPKARAPMFMVSDALAHFYLDLEEEIAIGTSPLFMGTLGLGFGGLGLRFGRAGFVQVFGCSYRLRVQGSASRAHDAGST